MRYNATPSGDYGWPADRGTGGIIDAIDRLRSCLCQAQPTTAAPTFNPPPGDYDEPQDVVIESTTPGAAIYYTLNGATPDASSTLYTGPVAITYNLTLKAIAIAVGHAPSTVTSGDYDVEPQVVTAPVFSPPAGDYETAQAVTITTPTPLAQSFYTTDGSEPTSLSTPYTTPVVISSDTVLKAIAYRTGFNPSSVTTGAYTISPTVAPPVPTPVNGTVIEYIFSDEPSFPALINGSVTTPTAGASLVFVNGVDTWDNPPVDGDGTATTVASSTSPQPTTYTESYRFRALKDGIYSSTVSFYWGIEPAVFWGWSPETELTPANFRDEIQNREVRVNYLKTFAAFDGDSNIEYGAPEGDYEFSDGGTGSDYFYICVPAGYKSLTTVKLGAFDMPMAGAAEGYTENDGFGPNYMLVSPTGDPGENYKVYRTYNAVGGSPTNLIVT